MSVTVLLVLLERNVDPRAFAIMLGPVAAVLFFFYIHRRYRNTDKSYRYEDRTRIELENIEYHDEYERHISRTRNPRVDGMEQSADPRRRLTGGPRSWWG